DDSFVMAATADRVPTVYVENGRVVGLDPKDPISVNYAERIGNGPTGRASPELLKLHPSHGHDQTIVNGISRIGYMTGGQAALWKDEDNGGRVHGARDRVRGEEPQPAVLPLLCAPRSARASRASPTIRRYDGPRASR